MASYPRREKAEREARERAAALVPALDCQACGAITSGDRYICERIVCKTCGGAQAAQTGKEATEE